MWIRSLNPDDAAALEYLWAFWARPKQISPWSPLRGPAERQRAMEATTTFLACAGRGNGKTRVGVEATNEEARELREHFRGALVARTAADIRDTMILGESGILAKSPPDFRPVWEPSNRTLRWPNGARATTFSAEEPDQMRGPQHNWAWGDEIAAWQYPDAYDQLQFGLRLQPYPRQVLTTTPRATPLVRSLLSDPRTVVMRGSMYENAENLAATFIAKIRRMYEGTDLGRQEIHAEVIDETPGALWKRAQINDHRVRLQDVPETIARVVAVDPSTTASDESDEAGIITAGSAFVGGVLHAFVFRDDSGRMTPPAWAERAVRTHDAMRADGIAAETNQGGDMVEQMIRMTAKEMRRDGRRANSEIAFHRIWAKEGKELRAAPVHALYQQGRVHHVGALGFLEDQQCTWVPGKKSPDRLDALVYAITKLILDAEEHDSPPMSLGIISRAGGSRVRGA